MAVTKRLSKSAGAVGAALALAAHYFPREEASGTGLAGFRDAAFFLGGQVDKWARWRGELPHEEKQRIGEVVAFAPEELASLGVFASGPVLSTSWRASRARCRFGRPARRPAVPRPLSPRGR